MEENINNNLVNIVTNPTLYSPIQDDDGLFIDKKVDFDANLMNHGLVCPCREIARIIFRRNANWKSHIKSKHHVAWIKKLNEEKRNILTEVDTLRRENKELKILNTQLQNEIGLRNGTVDLLTEQNLTMKKTIKTLTESIGNINLLD